VKKIIISIFFLGLFFFASATQIKAVVVTQNSGDLSVTWDTLLFPASTVWYPGLTVQKSFTVKNIGSLTHTASVQASSFSQTGNLASNLLFKISEGVNDLYGRANDETLKDFWDAGQVDLSDIAGGNSITYTITVAMPTELGNEFQRTNAKFDLIVGFVETPSTVNLDDGFVQGVLGITTSAVQTKFSTSSGQIKGVETINLKNCKQCFWWQILLIEVIVLLFYFLVISKRRQIKRQFLIDLSRPILVYIVYWFFNRACIKEIFFSISSNIFCRYFIFFDLLIYFLFYLLQ